MILSHEAPGQGEQMTTEGTGLAEKHIVCYSGGHSSALVAIEVVRRYGKENTVLV